MCSFVSPSLEAKVEARYCNSVCSDPAERACGDNAHYNVFATGLKAPKIAGDYYMGCYEHNETHTIMKKTTAIDFHHANTPEICSKYCDRRKFRYYGIMTRYSCWCGTVPPDDRMKQIDDAMCAVQCSGDASRFCGGAWSMAVFRIG